MLLVRAGPADFPQGDERFKKLPDPGRRTERNLELAWRARHDFQREAPSGTIQIPRRKGAGL